MLDHVSATRTFAAAHSSTLRDLQHPEMAEVGGNLFGNGSIVDSLYKIYLRVLTEEWQSNDSPNAHSVGQSLLQQGFYLPDEARTVLTGQIDLQNDGCSDYAAVPFFLEGEELPLIGVVTKCSFPRGVIRPCPGREMRVGMIGPTFWGDKTKALGEHCNFIVVKPNGHLIAPPVKGAKRDYFRSELHIQAGFCHLGATVLNAWADRQHLWNVRTTELVYNRPTPVTIGTSADRIKSLFYARSLPLTESGRKRPILHWVRAHERRLQAGIDIDVTQHLRGTDKFEMGGFAFEITNPVKLSPKREATP